MNKLIPLLAFSILLLVPLGIQQAFAGTSITVTTDQPSYVEGDTIIVSGIAMPIIPATPVTIQVFRDGNLVDIAQVTVAIDGTYSHTLIAQGPLWQFSGTYTVKSFYVTTSVETSFEFEGPQGFPPPGPPDDPPLNPTVTVNTERDCYTIGDLIQVFGDALPPSEGMLVLNLNK